MTFFKADKPGPPASQPDGPTRQAERGTRPTGFVDRRKELWPELFADPQPEEPVRPSHRQDMGKGRPKFLAEVEREPRGVLFVIDKGAAQGWFDLDGYWCRKNARNEIVVQRGAGRHIMKLLTKKQKSELDRVRLSARRHGIR